MRIRPIYSLLAIAATTIAIAVSSAAHVLVGEGRLVLAFSLGTALGMGWSCYVGLSNWQFYAQKLDELIDLTERSSANGGTLNQAAIALGSPGLFAKYRNPTPIMPEVISPDEPSTQLAQEIEIRELLDAVDRLSEYVMVDKVCRCCGVDTRNADHENDCDYVIATRIYDKGASRRESWSQFATENRLPTTRELI